MADATTSDADQHGPPWGPEPPAGISERQRAIYESRRLGHTYDAIGRQFEITGERVRQILDPLPDIVIPTRAARDLVAARRRAHEIVAVFREIPNIPEVAQRFGLNVGAVRAVIHDNEPDIRMYAAAPVVAPRYSEDDLLAALRAVAAASDTDQPTADQYRAYNAENRLLADGRPFPGFQSLLLRFDTLVEARRRAGLSPGTHAGPSRRWSAEDAARAVWEFWGQLGQAPTVAQYDDFSRGNSAVPSSAIVRRRITGGWANILRTAKVEAGASSLVLGAPDSEDAAPGTLPAPGSRVWGGPGRLPAPARRAVELRAMELAAAKLAEMGWTEIIDTSATEPYDLVARRDGEKELRAEVKGTTGAGEMVELTKNEVENARTYDPVCLIIVSQILLDDSEAELPTARGGGAAVYLPWSVEELGVLEATMFTYRLQ